MESGQIILLCVAGVFLLIVAKMVYDGVIRNKKLVRQIRAGYGALPKNDYSAKRYEDIGAYYNSKEKTGPVIDDITWNDLDMETIYMIINNTQSGVGEEYLYALLHMPCFDKDILEERNRVIEYFDTHEEERIKVLLELKKLGKLRNASVGQYLTGVKSMAPKNPALHIASLLALAASIVMSVFNVTFLPLFFLVIVVNSVTYFWYKGKVSSYFVVFSYLSRMTQTAQKIAALKLSGIDTYNQELKDCLRPLKDIGRYSWLFVSGTDFSGDLLALVLDYIKMMTHIDLIIFDRMVYSIYTYRKELDRMLDIIGELDCDIAIGSYRAYMGGQVCIPELTQDGDLTIYAQNVYHPMIINPVKNTLDEEKSVLVTGSNASGKSTFLKTIAINAILAQTIYTCLADCWKSRFFRIYSSMALQDNVQGGESYYIVEIKSLKRIIDAASVLDTPVLCFIDEVLRGTNTVERIAASSRILHELAHKNAFCFAATHDIELTSILENTYANYHFQEEVNENEVTFDYMLHKGRATSRNAIKLLGMIGFDKTITDEATAAARAFETDGFWAAMTK